MNIIDNFSINRLFINKAVTITLVDYKKSFIVNLFSVKEFHTNNDLNAIYHLITSNLSKVQSIYLKQLNSSYDIVTQMIFELGMYSKYNDIANKMRNILKLIIPNINIDMLNHTITIDDITITDEIWDYILYILKLSCGEKVNKPLNFESEEARKFYMAQREYEEKINNIRQSNGGDVDGLIKMILSITYTFPSMTIDYLYNQTMAQICWLQRHAAGARSYEVNTKIFAAGNMEKGKKPDFFIK